MGVKKVSLSSMPKREKGDNLKTSSISGIVARSKEERFEYEKYTQSAMEHQKGYFIALNNRFPNLVGFGIVQYLKQLMAINPRCKLIWSEETARIMCQQMNVEFDVFKEVVNYCIQIRMFRIIHSWVGYEGKDYQYLTFPDFMEELIQIEIKKLRRESEVEWNTFKEVVGGESASSMRTRVLDSMKSFLILTPDMEETVRNFYPGIGEPKDLWDEFVRKIEDEFMRYWDELSKDNYKDWFYAYLNSRP